MGLCFSLTIASIGMLDKIFIWQYLHTSKSAYIYNHLSHLVVVIQQADVLLLYDCDKIGQLSRQFGASISEAVHAVLNVKPGLQIYWARPACKYFLLN